MHRREWHCKLCNLTISSHTAFQHHLEVKHSKLFIPTQLQVIIDRCERLTAANQQCPFCQTEVLSSHVHRHLARHMQQIALFVLNSYEEEEDTGDRGSKDVCASESNQEDQESRGRNELVFDSNPPSNVSDEEIWGSVGESDNLEEGFISQHISGRYVSLTVLTEYLKERWPITPTEIDVSHFPLTRILLANSRN